MIDHFVAQRNTRDVLAQVKISAVYRELAGIEPRWTGRDTWRAHGVGGDNQDRISGDDARGVWHDFRDDSGGGILDLIVQLRGGSRADALAWAAAFVGVSLSDRPFSAIDRERWAAERRELERALPVAGLWRRAAVNMAAELLDNLKAGLTDPTLPQASIGEIGNLDGLLCRLRRIDGAELVAEHGWWREHYPGLTGLMIRAARAREQVERRALVSYLGMPDTGRCAA